ncbi:diguanylate cyclase response regulator [Ferrigenium kumadai]|uniref:diguanylate cyclase n=1 Tax=Ferrigenium kumadai TaxID=1682490 RepID=A0AAN1SY32_9PROT|nr:diguanylate cyclase [Ferrigenium kumadai]BBI99098.1 diguanylate cyclase response regulator [Ferrigenium kumadai]
MDNQTTAAATGDIAHPFMVMLVDDQPFVAELLRRQLINEKDINFHYCQDPTQAVSTAERIGPTVILLDFTMPVMDGLTLCQFIRAHPTTRDIPIIMLSSNDDPVTKAAAFAAGANDYVVKLPDSVELVARLRYHSGSYVSRLQRDDAYRALRASQIKLEELNMQLLKLANIDGLTGIANRRHFDERLAAEWLRALRNRRPISLIMFDVDLFKLYNDKFGHLDGDECLKRLAHTAQDVVSRPADTVARYGGEEFIVLLPETDSSGAIKVAEKLRAEIENLHLPHPDSKVSPYVTISLGVTTILPEASSTPDVCLKVVDEALYRAKDSGRNRLSVATCPAG